MLLDLLGQILPIFLIKYRSETLLEFLGPVPKLHGKCSRSFLGKFLTVLIRSLSNIIGNYSSSFMGQFLCISSLNLDLKSMEILLEPPEPDPTSFVVKSLSEIYRKCFWSSTNSLTFLFKSLCKK